MKHSSHQHFPLTTTIKLSHTSIAYATINHILCCFNLITRRKKKVDLFKQEYPIMYRMRPGDTQNLRTMTNWSVTVTVVN